MQRRRFLQYSSLGAMSFAISACGSFNSNRKSQNQSSATDPRETSAVDFGTLEKNNLVVGYLPVIGATPLIVAKEKGFFQRYGLTVTLSRQLDWQSLETGLKEYQFDVAQTPYASPILAQLGKEYAPMVNLMVLHRHGSSIILDRNAWDSSLRPVNDYFSLEEFAKDFRQYHRQGETSLIYGIDSLTSNNYYLLRYWFSTFGIRTEDEIEWAEFPPLQMIHKLQAGMINGYCSDAPWSNQAIAAKQGFTASLTQEVWQGHPGSILSTMIPWLESHPTTARAFLAAMLEACQYCDGQENRGEIEAILAQPQYFNTDLSLINRSLAQTYEYGGFDDNPRAVAIADYMIFHRGNTEIFKENDHANYPWLSHGVWFLTQLLRWRSLELKNYPQDADNKLEKTYAFDLYEEVAKSLNIPLPSERLKIEPSTAFIDQREFDPSNPVNYLNQFPRGL